MSNAGRDRSGERMSAPRADRLSGGFARTESTMNARQHTMLARLLIDACGGVDACCKPVTRVERSALYAYRDFDKPHFMPADVIEALERKCGNPIYSTFLFEAAKESSRVQAVACVGSSADQVHISAFKLWEAAKDALADGELSELEKRELDAGLQRLEDAARTLRNSLDAETLTPGAPT